MDSAILPYRNNQFVVDQYGQPITGSDGFQLIKFKPGETQQIVTTVFSGVSKMFCVYQDDETSVAAVTSGMAILGGVTIAEQAKRFRRRVKNDKQAFAKVEDVANDFKTFMHEIWVADFNKSGVPEIQYFPSIQFIIAGYGKDDGYGRVFRVDLFNDSLVEQFPADDHTGVCWGGTANYVERLLRGSDGLLQYKVSRELTRAMTQQREGTIADLSRALTEAGVTLPSGLDIQVREEQLPTLPWDSVTADIDYGNLSTQYAVDFVELLVNIQSGMQRFGRGIPIVGGRTHIGVLKRGEHFEMLNEPQLQHRHTGYADEF